MHYYISKKLQLFLNTEYFFLNQLFYRFNKCYVSKKSHIRSLILKKAGSLFILFLFVFAPKIWGQQDPQFSQNMFNFLAVNPGYAGSSDMINLMAVSRQQWVGLEGRPKTTVFGADAAIAPFGVQSGIGINFMNDQLGFLNNITGTLSYSTKYELKFGTLGVGLSVGFYNQVLDPSSGEGWITGGEPDPNGNSNTSNEQDDPLLFSNKVSGSAADFGIGAFLKNEQYYVGFSMTHLFNPSPKFDENYFFYLKRHYYLMGGYTYPLRDKPIVLNPSIFFKSDGASFQTDLNINAVYKKRYWGGLSYRLQDAIVLLAGIELKNGLKIGYSYDIPISKSATNFGGSHEMMFGYTFDLNFDKKNRRYRSVRYL